MYNYEVIKNIFLDDNLQHIVFYATSVIAKTIGDQLFHSWRIETEIKAVVEQKIFNKNLWDIFCGLWNHSISYGHFILFIIVIN